MTPPDDARTPVGQSPMGRVTALLALFGLLLCAGLGVLVFRSGRAAAREEALRHELVAARLFDELERELTALVDREEARSFLEYRYFYVPERQVPGQPALARSPLSEPPVDPAVVGYFQVEPDGAVVSPLRPRPDEEAVARRSYGWVDDPATGEGTERLAVLWRDALWPAPESPPRTDRPVAVARNEAEAQAKEPTSSRYGLYQELNRAVQGRSRRAVQSVPTQSANVADFQSQAWDVTSTSGLSKVGTALESEPAVAPARSKPAAAPPRPENRPLRAAGTVDVEVSPFRGGASGDDALVLERTVRIGSETWRQGLVLDRDGLVARLEGAVLGESALAPFVSLAWAASPVRRSAPRSGTWGFVHAFAPPFEALAVEATLAPMPGQRVEGRWVVPALALLLALGALVGGVALRGMVAVRLEYAARRGDFVAAVSHELKTPLTSIRMMAEMLRDGMVPAEERRQQYLETITAEAERLSRLIANVLELARIEKGTRDVRWDDGSVEEVVRQVPEVLGPHLRSLGFSLEIRVARDLPAAAFDRDALLQVLVNLVDNAAKFSRETADRTVALDVTPGGRGVLLTVRDHGPGVPPRQIARIFEPFYRGERELTRRTRGTGIGLALVRGLVTRMGGTVIARNHPEGGLEVVVELRRR